MNPSALTEGWHPGFLLHISEEATPADWQMAKQSPTMWRWHFVLWEVPTLIDRQAPEHQSGLTSTKFSPKGKFQASKAYTWTKQMLARDIPPGQSVNWDTLYPVPCRVKVERTPGKDFIKMLDVEAWPEGQPFTVSMAEPLRLARAEAVAAPPPVIPPLDTPAPQAHASPAAATRGHAVLGHAARRPGPAARRKPRRKAGSAMAALRVRLTSEPDGRTCVESPYHQGLIEQLKATIPLGSREWNNDRKRWLVSALYVSDLLHDAPGFGCAGV